MHWAIGGGHCSSSSGVRKAFLRERHHHFNLRWTVFGDIVSMHWRVKSWSQKKKKEKTPKKKTPKPKKHPKKKKKKKKRHQKKKKKKKKPQTPTKKKKKNNHKQNSIKKDRKPTSVQRTSAEDPEKLGHKRLVRILPGYREVVKNQSSQSTRD